MNATAAAPRAGRKEVVGLAVLTLPTLLLAMDMSVLYLALPHLTADLGAGATEQLWAIDIYGFMIAGFLITMGGLGDRIGRRKLLLVGAATFTVMSVVAAYATSIEVLIVARAALGVAGATLMPSTLALINNLFREPRQRALATGVWMSCFLGGVAVGPVVGGVLLEHFWWGSVFLVAVPVMLLLIVSGPFVLPEYRDQSARRIDLVSSALSLAAILPVVYGVKEIAKDGLTVIAVVAILAGIGFGLVFVRRQRRLDDPMLAIDLFRNPRFSSALSFMLLGGVMAGYNFLIAQYLQMVEGFSPLRAGLWLILPAVAGVAGSMLGPAIARRVRPAYVIAGGMALSAAGMLLITQVGSIGGLSLLMTGLVAAFMGSGPLGALSTDLVVGSAPPERAGSAAAMSETSAELGVSLGVALIGSIATAVYRGQLSEQLGGITGEPAARASESIVAAASAADRLPAPLADQLLDRAGAAFTAGLNVAAGVSGLVALALGLVAVFSLRELRPYTDVSGDPQATGKQD